jgi:predicted PurR-regulated permease PerM
MTLGDTNSSSRDSLGRLARRTLVVVVIVGLVWLAWRIVSAFLLAFLGILLATWYRGLAGLVSRYTRMSVEWALLVVAFLLIGLVALFIWLAGPPINNQLSQLTKTLPASFHGIEEVMKRSVVGQYLLGYVRQAAAGPGPGISLFSGIAGVATTVYTVAGDILLVIISAIYFSVNPGVYRRGILLLIPRSQTMRVAEVLEETARILRHWLLGQLVLMFSVGTMAAFGLWLVGIPLAFLLGIIAGLLEFIPVIGPLVAAVPGILIGITQGWLPALDAALVYLLVQQVENHILVPLVQKTAVNVPPALVILALVAFGLLFGFLGVLVATPLTAVAIVWVKAFYVHDVLGRSVDLKE